MIELSVNQCKQLALPLITLTMGEEVGAKAELEFSSSDVSDLWALFDKGQLIAICGLGGHISEKKVWLGYFAVHPKYRRGGLGRYCLNCIETIAKARGYKWILVETYEHPIFENAIDLYKKCDYKEIGYIADYLDDDSDALYLRKNIGD